MNKDMTATIMMLENKVNSGISDVVLSIYDCKGNLFVEGTYSPSNVCTNNINSGIEFLTTDTMISININYSEISSIDFDVDENTFNIKANGNEFYVAF